jgi:hypothetical protein
LIKLYLALLALAGLSQEGKVRRLLAQGKTTGSGIILTGLVKASLTVQEKEVRKARIFVNLDRREKTDRWSHPIYRRTLTRKGEPSKYGCRCQFEWWGKVVQSLQRRGVVQPMCSIDLRRAARVLRPCLTD